MATIPAPFYALVGATDVVTEKARALPERLAAFEISRFETPQVRRGSFDVTGLDPRNIDLTKIELPKVDLSKVELPKVDLSKVELPKVDLSKVELPKVEVRRFEASDVAAYALQVAAKAEQTYDHMVVRGEHVVARVRGTEALSVPVVKPAKPAAKKATKPARKKATKPASKKAPKKATKPATPTTTAAKATPSA